MSRRSRLIALVVLETLLLAFSIVDRVFPMALGGPSTSISVAYIHLSLSDVVLALLFIALPLFIGLTCRTWQSAIALAGIPGTLPLLLELALSHSPFLSIATLGVVIPLGALGWLGWLARSIPEELRGKA